MSLADRIREKTLVETDYAGIRYRLRPVTTGDLIQRHSAILAAIMPPTPAAILEEAAIDEAEGEEKKSLLRRRALEFAKEASKPEVQAQALELAEACLCAAVVEADVGEGWEPLRVVARQQDADPAASPPRLWAQDLPAGTIQRIGGIARQLAFGGEEERQRLRSFRAVGPAADSGADR